MVISDVSLFDISGNLSGSNPGAYSSSPVLADDKIYVTNEDGTTTVYSAGPEFRILAENVMDEYTLSSVAISEGQLFLRTDSFLYAVGERREN